MNLQKHANKSGLLPFWAAAFLLILRELTPDRPNFCFSVLLAIPCGQKLVHGSAFLASRRSHAAIAKLCGLRELVPSDMHAPRVRSRCALRAAISCCDGESNKIASLHQQLEESQLQQLEQLVDEVEASGKPDLVEQPRAFGGAHGDSSFGHAVTFLHGHAREDIYTLFRQLALQAVAQLPAWHISSNVNGDLTLRCLEAIGYKGVSGNADSDEYHKQDALGWHTDGATLFTIVLALSTTGVDFEGGELEVQDARNSRREILEKFTRGDVVVFRGWQSHRVRRVQTGIRKVIVGELWLGQECTQADPRPRDTECDLRQVLSLAPNSRETHLLLASLLQEQGDLASAEKTLRACLEWYPRDAEIQYQLACILMDQGEVGDAEASLRKSVLFNPRNLDAFHNLGILLLEKGDIDGAKKALSKLHGTELHGVDTCKQLAYIAILQGDSDSARQYLMPLLETHPDDAEVHYYLASLYNDSGDKLKAEQFALSALELEPDDEQIRAELEVIAGRTR